MKSKKNQRVHSPGTPAQLDGFPQPRKAVPLIVNFGDSPTLEMLSSLSHSSSSPSSSSCNRNTRF